MIGLPEIGDSDVGDVPGRPAALPSPNIWNSPQVYEIENLGVDRDRRIEASILAGIGRTGTGDMPSPNWAGLDVVDLGCGSGFHLPRFADSARSVIGIEPHPPLAAAARDRMRGHRDLPARVEVREAPAQDTGLPSASIDLAHARWAYFFGPGCEPGLAELDRIMRPGSSAWVIDNDATRSRFGQWFRRALPDYDPAAVERFWSRRGWQRERLEIDWRFDSRADFESVVRIEFAPAIAETILAEEPGRTGVDYAINLWHRRF